MKVILVPVDFSADAIAAQQLSVARQFVEGSDGKLVLLHVTPSITGYVQSQVPRDILVNALAEAKKKLHDLAKANGVADTAELVLLEGQPAHTILELASKINADLIIIASHDPDLSDYLLGSTAARVVRHAHCSVFIVRNLKD